MTFLLCSLSIYVASDSGLRKLTGVLPSSYTPWLKTGRYRSWSSRYSWLWIPDRVGQEAWESPWFVALTNNCKKPSAELSLSRF